MHAALVLILTLPVVSITCFIAAGVQSGKRRRYAYNGPMRIKGSEYELRIQSRSRRDCDTSTSSSSNNYDSKSGTTTTCHTTRWREHFYDAVLHVEWASQWACPSEQEEKGEPFLCESTIIVDHCSEFICADDACPDRFAEDAAERVERCLLEYFDETYGNYTEYKYDDHPSNDIDWPSVVAFGDCNKCSSRFKLPSRGSITALTVVGSVTLVLTVLCSVAACFIRLQS